MSEAHHGQTILSSGKKYKHSFILEDLRDLKKSMGQVKGSYLMNLSLFDRGMEDIFGVTNKTIDYANPADNHGKNK